MSAPRMYCFAVLLMGVIGLMTGCDVGPNADTPSPTHAHVPPPPPAPPDVGDIGNFHAC